MTLCEPGEWEIMSKDIGEATRGDVVCSIRGDDMFGLVARRESVLWSGAIGVSRPRGQTRDAWSAGDNDGSLDHNLPSALASLTCSKT